MDENGERRCILLDSDSYSLVNILVVSYNILICWFWTVTVEESWHFVHLMAGRAFLKMDCLLLRLVCSYLGPSCPVHHVVWHHESSQINHVLQCMIVKGN